MAKATRGDLGHKRDQPLVGASAAAAIDHERVDMRRSKRQPATQATIFDLGEPPASLAVPNQAGRISALYDAPIPSSRRGALFNAHSYPTKINVTAAIACILAHTEPGDVVFDGFAGSGVTGLAAALCGHADLETRNFIESTLPSAVWGERDSVLYDLSVLAAFIADSLLNPPDPDEFAEAAASLAAAAELELGWMYAAKGPNGEPGTIRHTLWTEHLVCPECGMSTSFWEAAVRTEPPTITEAAVCRCCSAAFPTASAKRLTEAYDDDLLNQSRERRVRTPAFVYGISGRSRWKREATLADLDFADQISQLPIPPTVPVVRMLNTEEERWGHMFRRGYHFGIQYVHDFYTRRNLVAVSRAWELVSDYPEHLQQALRFWISSYNATHSTLMTRIVCKRSAKDFVLTGAQPAALYVGGLPVEKNVFLGLRRKIATITSAFRETSERSNRSDVFCGSSLAVGLPDGSVDYVFTDPPFGDNIQYSEVNFISEAWLGRFTNAEDEVVINPVQGKSVDDYGELLSAAFSEAYRILKPGKYMTVAFHSTQPAVWEVLRAGWERAGFQIVTTSILDKSQTSFKQTTTEGAVQKDPLVLLRKPTDATVIDLTVHRSEVDYWKAIERRIIHLSDHPTLRSKRHLFSYLITYCLEHGLPIPHSAEEFYAALETRFSFKNGAYEVP